MRRPGLAIALALLTVFAGCGVTDPGADADGEDVIGRDAFVAVYVELHRARVASADSVAFAARRADILARHGVEPEALEAFVEAHADDVEYLSEVWDTIEMRLEALEGDSARS